MAVLVDALTADDSAVCSGSCGPWLTVEISSSHQTVADMQVCNENVVLGHTASIKADDGWFGAQGTGSSLASPSSSGAFVQISNTVGDGRVAFVSSPAQAPDMPRFSRNSPAGSDGKCLFFLYETSEKFSDLQALLSLHGNMAMLTILDLAPPLSVGEAANFCSRWSGSDHRAAHFFHMGKKIIF